jgi:dihydroflavonol-4-reductase
MRAFVTGATGLLGAHLTRMLTEQGHEVTALVRSRRKAAEVLGGLRTTLVEGDICETAGFAAALEGCDTLFHTAAYFREYTGGGGGGWETIERINVRATIDLLRAAERAGVRRAVHTSSSGVIGARPDGSTSDESDGPDREVFENLYYKSKHVAEGAVRDFLATSRLEVMMALPGWMFGPGDAAPTSAGQVVLDFLNRKFPAVIPGGGAPADVRDVADGMIRMAERGRSGERYLLGGDRYYTLGQLLGILERVSGVPAPRAQVPYPVAYAMIWAMEQSARLTGAKAAASVRGLQTLQVRRVTSSAKAIRELGASFRPVEETMRDAVAWFRANRAELLVAPGARGVASA